MAWSVVEETFVFADSRWNHSSLTVWAVPHSKIFVFGGNSGDLNSGNPQGTKMNNMQVIDTGEFKIWDPLCTGAKPAPRENSELLYDEETHRLMCFGGWDGKWFGELSILNAVEIIGPPYSIVSIEPQFGPVTGDAKLQVTGINLQDFVGKKCTVRFACEKGFQDCHGSVIDENTAECLTPAFNKFGPVGVEVRISVDSKPFTNTACMYKFHSVTKASNTLAFGPGVQHGGATGKSTMFVIQSLDTRGKLRDTGGDEFKVKIKCDSDIPKTKKAPASITKVTDITVVDNLNGTYTGDF
jgi:dynein heavy chain